MAQIPKGRLVKGPYKPICRGCAIYFSPGVTPFLEHIWILRYIISEGFCWGKTSKPTRTLTKENSTCICNTPTKYQFFFNTHVFLPTIIHSKTYTKIISHYAIVSIYHYSETKISFQDVFPCVIFNTWGFISTLPHWPLAIHYATSISVELRTIATFNAAIAVFRWPERWMLPPKKWGGLEDDLPFQSGDFQVPAVSFEGCSC